MDLMDHGTLAAAVHNGGFEGHNGIRQVGYGSG